MRSFMDVRTAHGFMPEALCFDVYGSTHDQHSTPVRRIREVTGVADPVAERVSRHWALEQLRYSFEVTMMDRYETWWSLADRALDYALEYHGLALEPDEREAVLEAYQHLEPHEDWAPFERLGEAFDLYVLSDGNPEMLATLAANTGFDEHLDGVVSADEVGVYKPRPEVYERMAAYVDGGVDECVMVATHHFDVAGAMNAGMSAAFVNRFGEPTTRLGVEPDVAVGSYAELADELV